MRYPITSYLLLISALGNPCNGFLSSLSRLPTSPSLFASQIEDPLDQTKRQLEKIKRQSLISTSHEGIYQEFINKPANALKTELLSLRLSAKGRKPDLARRLTDYYIAKKEAEASKAAGGSEEEEEELEMETPSWATDESEEELFPVTQFGSLPLLSPAAGMALAKAQFRTPTSIQSKALSRLAAGESLVLHAETGSGKSEFMQKKRKVVRSFSSFLISSFFHLSSAICYLLPITERLWQNQGSNDSEEPSYALVLTPTRELAAQVAGVATALAPPGSVRLVTTPTNLVRQTFQNKERSESKHGGRFDFGDQGGTKLIVGSAKSIMISLFGDSKKMPAPPTSKPEAQKFLRSVDYVVLDEVGK